MLDTLPHIVQMMSNEKTLYETDWPFLRSRHGRQYCVLSMTPALCAVEDPHYAYHITIKLGILA